MSHNSREDQVVLVDKNNNRIGIGEKIKAHKEGKLHRAFSIFIFNSKGELLIQQRATTKYHSGGLWSNTVCSHPKPDESFEQAVHRRLKEEMGFDCDLKKVFAFVYNTGLQNDLIENEYDCVYFGKYNGKTNPNYKEIMDYKWITIRELMQDIVKNPEKYTVWLKLILKRKEFIKLKDKK